MPVLLRTEQSECSPQIVEEENNETVVDQGKNMSLCSLRTGTAVGPLYTRLWPQWPYNTKQTEDPLPVPIPIDSVLKMVDSDGLPKAGSRQQALMKRRLKDVVEKYRKRQENHRAACRDMRISELRRELTTPGVLPNEQDYSDVFVKNIYWFDGSPIALFQNYGRVDVSGVFDLFLHNAWMLFDYFGDASENAFDLIVALERLDDQKGKLNKGERKWFMREQFKHYLSVQTGELRALGKMFVQRVDRAIKEALDEEADKRDLESFEDAVRKRCLFGLKYGAEPSFVERLVDAIELKEREIKKNRRARASSITTEIEERSSALRRIVIQERKMQLSSLVNKSVPTRFEVDLISDQDKAARLQLDVLLVMDKVLRNVEKREEMISRKERKKILRRTAEFAKKHDTGVMTECASAESRQEEEVKKENGRRKRTIEEMQAAARESDENAGSAGDGAVGCAVPEGALVKVLPRTLYRVENAPTEEENNNIKRVPPSALLGADAMRYE